MTDRIPVFIRVGDAFENLVGSVRIEAAPGENGEPDKVRIVGGALGMADLLEAAALEIRRNAGQPARPDYTTVLIAASEHDAKTWQARYPGRWSEVCPASPTAASTLEGLRVAGADVTPAALASEHLDQVVAVVERSIALTVPAGARTGVGYLTPQ